MNDSDLIQHHITGADFSWSNNGVGDQQIRQRIDKVLHTAEWIQLFPKATASYDAAIASDHCPIILLHAPRMDGGQRHSLDDNPSSSHTGNQNDIKGWKELWNLKVIPKVKIFGWRECKNVLATGENLTKHRVIGNYCCPRCGVDMETIEHVLFFCPFASMVWVASGLNYKQNVNGFPSMKQWWDSVATMIPSFGDFCSKSLVAVTCWNIWKARNKLILYGTVGNPIDVWLGAYQDFQNASSLLNQQNPIRNSGSINNSFARANAIWTSPMQCESTWLPGCLGNPNVMCF